MITVHQFSDSLYGIPKIKDTQHRWKFWNEFEAAKRSGALPKDLPGYLYVKWRNDSEKMWEADEPKTWPGFGSAAEGEEE